MGFPINIGGGEDAKFFRSDFPGGYRGERGDKGQRYSAHGISVVLWKIYSISDYDVKLLG